jgi:hypothetical protein
MCGLRKISYQTLALSKKSLKLNFIIEFEKEEISFGFQGYLLNP